MLESRGNHNDFTSNFRSTILRKYKNKNIILFQGEVPPLALVIKSGFVISYTISNSGDEQIIAFYTVGDVIPVEWVFSRSPVSLYYYRAFTDCIVTAINREEFRESIDKDHLLSNKLLNQFANSFIGSTVHIHALEHSHSQDKIIKIMHYLVLRFGIVDRNKSDVYKMPFKLTHSQIASLVGITRESVTIEAIKLKKRGALQYKGGIYTVNLPVLISSLGSEEFDSLKIR